MTGHYLHLVERRDAILSTARMSPAARARAMGRTYWPPPRKVEVPAPVEKSDPLPEAPYRAPVRHYFRSAHADIYNAVGEAYGVSVYALQNPNRRRSVSWPRFAFFRLLREKGLSTTKIGRIAHLDHTTVLHGLRRASELLATDPEWAERYHAAERLLKAAQ